MHTLGFVASHCQLCTGVYLQEVKRAVGLHAQHATSVASHCQLLVVLRESWWGWAM